MTREEAIRKLKCKGHENIVEVSFPKNHINHNHTHPFDAEIIVISGSMKVVVGQQETNLGNGDGLELTANIEHSELVGTDGVTFLAARPVV